MSAILRKDNFRVVIVARRLGDYGWMSTSMGTDAERNAHAEKESHRIAAEARRHLDGLDQITVECDRAMVCEFCSEPWAGALAIDDDDPNAYPDGLPLCCDAAQAEFWMANPDKWATSKQVEPWAGGSPWPWEVSA